MTHPALEQESYEGLGDRDSFHIMLNLDSHPGFLPVARTLADGYLAAARERQDAGGLEAELRIFPYTKAAYEARMGLIYQGLVDDVTRYEAKQSWTLRTRDDVVEWLRQMAPFNQTDGAWLRKIAPVGPMDEVRALLLEIFVEELGSGDPELNHANIYTDLLRSVDIDLPDIRSREYADNPDLLDSAFTLPLFQLVVSEFSQTFLPELLGMTQYLEWSSVELKNMVLLNEHFGLDPHFYAMHVAIDNAATGHGAMAKRAVELYLEQVRTDVGEDAMQAQWERVWNGYVAFATTGTLAQDMRQRRPRPSAPAEKVLAIVQGRAPVARLNHGQQRLGGTLINDLFADPPALLAALVTGGMILPGDPDHSPFFGLLGPDGPMYTIFDDAEIATWREWAASLTQPTAAPAGDTPTSPGDQMMRLVDAMRPRQEGQPAHAAEQLTGPDPANSTALVTEPVAWWFGQPTRSLMRALAHDTAWVAAGDVDASRFVTDLLRGSNDMSRALGAEVDVVRHLTGVQVATEWINAGCPIPDDAGSSPRPLTFLSPPDRVDAHPTGVIHGSGSVH